MQCADKQSLAPAGFLLAHGFGQNGFQRGFRRATVVIGNPAREFQDLRRDERLGADDFQNGFEIGMCGFLGEGGDATQNFSRAEWHLYAAADLDLSGQSGRNQIIELLAERDFEADAGNHDAVTSEQVTGDKNKQRRAGVFHVTCHSSRVALLIPRDGAQLGFKLLSQRFALGVGGFGGTRMIRPTVTSQRAKGSGI